MDDTRLTPNAGDLQGSLGIPFGARKGLAGGAVSECVVISHAGVAALTAAHWDSHGAARVASLSLNGDASHSRSGNTETVSTFDVPGATRNQLTPLEHDNDVRVSTLPQTPSFRNLDGHFTLGGRRLGTARGSWSLGSANFSTIIAGSRRIDPPI